MSDDLVKRLRELAGRYDEAADRIEKLEAVLHQWDDLIRHQYNGSREAMSDMTDAAGITAALLHGDEPWPETRIEKLEAALQEFIDPCIEHCFDTCQSECDPMKDCPCFKARKALEGKDD